MLKHISFFYIHSHPTKKTEHIYSLNKKKERKENVPHTHTPHLREKYIQSSSSSMLCTQKLLKTVRSANTCGLHLQYITKINLSRVSNRSKFKMENVQLRRMCRNRECCDIRFSINRNMRFFYIGTKHMA